VLQRAGVDEPRIFRRGAWNGRSSYSTSSRETDQFREWQNDFVPRVAYRRSPLDNAEGGNPVGYPELAADGYNAISDTLKLLNRRVIATSPTRPGRWLSVQAFE
jgi:hypothetical protein